MCCSVYVSRSSQARFILFCAFITLIVCCVFGITIPVVVCLAADVVALLLMLNETFFFVMRKTSFTRAISFVFLLVVCASALMLWQSIAATYLAYPVRPAAPGILACFWLTTAFNLLNIFVIGAMLGRGSDVDVGLKRLVLYGNAGAFFSCHLGLLYRISARRLTCAIATCCEFYFVYCICDYEWDPVFYLSHYDNFLCCSRIPRFFLSCGILVSIICGHAKNKHRLFYCMCANFCRRCILTAGCWIRLYGFPK